ncbi:MAG: hypothetical protein JSS83_01670 [Cyanobacteria bacterium SZAS LIN-3]|nr:hypothetical protein [Cyanobacteria bacterium SZAS LIN-3]MBS2007822.1 hypothetical protein [Cyanobacteria bacterium SZAS TMP-1]
MSSFGGVNRGPAAERRKTRPARSNMFVDFATVALLIGCGGAVVYQYWPLFSTSGYQVASGHLERMGLTFSGYSASGYTYSRRRNSYINFLEARYSFVANGRQYQYTVTSLPIFSLAALDTIGFENECRLNGLPIRYDPANPDNNVAAPVIECFGKAVLVSYVVVIFIGFIFIAMAGMSNLSGERWRP